MTKQSKTIFLLALALTLTSCAFKKDSKNPGEARPTPYDSHHVEKKSLMIQRENEETYTSTFLELGINHYQLSNPLILEVDPMPKSFTFTMQVGEIENISRVKALANGSEYTDKRVNVLINGKRILKGVTFVDLTIEDVSELGLPNQHEKTARLDLYLNGAVYTVEFRTTPAPVSVTSRMIDIGKEKNVAFDGERDLIKVAELEFRFHSDKAKIVVPRNFTTELKTGFFELVYVSSFPASEMGPGNRNSNSPTDEECAAHSRNSYSFNASSIRTFFLVGNDESVDEVKTIQDTNIEIHPTGRENKAIVSIFAYTNNSNRDFSKSGVCRTEKLRLINGCHRERCFGANDTGKCEGGRWQLIVEPGNFADFENHTEITGTGADFQAWFHSAVATYSDIDSKKVNITGKISSDSAFKFAFSGSVKFNSPTMEPPAGCN